MSRHQSQKSCVATWQNWPLLHSYKITKWFYFLHFFMNVKYLHIITITSTAVGTKSDALLMVQLKMCALHLYFVAVIQESFEKILKPCVFYSQAQQTDTLSALSTSVNAHGRHPSSHSILSPWDDLTSSSAFWARPLLLSAASMWEESYLPYYFCTLTIRISRRYQKSAEVLEKAKKDNRNNST